MKTRLSVGALMVLVALLTLGFLTPPESWAQSTGGPLNRLSADFKNFDETETSTVVGAFPGSVGSMPGDDGQVVYRKTVFVPFDQNVLYITFSATGDTHDGAALWLSCRVNGARCNPGSGGAAGTTPGYVSLQKMPSFVALPTGAIATCNDGGGGFGDCHDNNLNYTWCVQLADFAGGTFTIELRLATSESGKEVFFETAHVFIDSNCITGNACEQAEPLNGG
ncbi:MAG: hypothetical protein ACRDQ2_16990 [Gaiellales bacterium]